MNMMEKLKINGGKVMKSKVEKMKELCGKKYDVVIK
jgi:hypothetical protein